MLHDLGMRFDTPIINACFHASDFVKFCKNMKFYISTNLIEDNNTEMNYPVGILGEGENIIRIHFMHYKNFSQAKQKWYERISRIHWDNLFIIMTDSSGCNEDIAREFDSLPYEHKVLLTYRDYDGVKSAVKFNIEREKLPDYGLGAVELFAFKADTLFSGKRIIDDWDYISWLNS